MFPRDGERGNPLHIRLMPVSSERLLERAARARRESKRVAFAEDFDAAHEGDWIELVKDVVALANSGGGVVVVDEAALVRDEIRVRLERYAEPRFDRFELHSLRRHNTTVTAIVVDDVEGIPLVFTQEGRYVDHVAFNRGGLFSRHGNVTICHL